MTRKEWLQNNFTKIKALYPDLKTIYGPYNNSKDGRSRIVLYNGKERPAKQYCRIKMEVKLGRVLHMDETVDHDDGDILNDKYKNLILRTRKDHVKLDVTRRDYSKEDNCLWCGRLFTLTKTQVRDGGRTNQKAGPFCSRSCTGKYGAEVRAGGLILKRNEYKKVLYKNKSKE